MSFKRKYLVKINDNYVWNVDASDYYTDLKNVRNRIARRKTLKKNIMFNCLEWYVTFTFDKEKKDRYKDNWDAIRQILHRYGIKYSLYIEYHKDGAIHYHGFISDNDYMKPYKKDKYGSMQYRFEPLQKNYGNTICYKNVNEAMIRYVIKYATKNALSCKSSRLNKNDKFAIELFGNIVKKDLSF